MTLGMKLPKDVEKKVLDQAGPHLIGEHCMTVNVTLPWPPSVNHLYAVSRGRKVMSEQGRAYQEAVGAACALQKCNHVTGFIEATIYCHPDNERKFDLDNLLKATLDSLQKAGLYRDDCQINSITIKRCPSGNDPRIVVHLRGDYPREK